MNTSMQDLKPCPFCGHVGVNVHEGSTFRWVLAECDNCGAQSTEARRDTMKPWPNEAEDTPKAIAEWNTRAAIEAATAQGKRQPLTDEQIEILWTKLMCGQGSGNITDFVRAIEAAHGITATPKESTP